MPSDPNEYPPGSEATVLEPGSMWRAAHRFHSWNTLPNGMGYSYMPGDQIQVGAQHVELHAIWNSVPTYSITYWPNGAETGQPPVDNTQYEAGDDVVLMDAGSMKRTRLRLLGWTESINGTGTLYEPGASFVMPSSDVNLFAQWVPYEVGDRGPAGGLIFYVDASAHFAWDYLEAAPSDQGSVEWGGYGIEVGYNWAPDLQVWIGEGAQNTQLIVDALGHNGGPMYAAKLCDDLVLNGYDDWFLPSLNELIQMYRSLHRDGLGAFLAAQYWASSEVDELAAHGVYFVGGGDIEQSKNANWVRVRAARSF